MIYTIKKGDSLSKIARRAGVSMTLIQTQNPIIKDKNKIEAGWKIKLPGYAEIKALKIKKMVQEKKIGAAIPRSFIVRPKFYKRTAAGILRKRKTVEKAPEVSILKETIKGLPAAAVIVYKKIRSTAPEAMKTHQISFKRIASVIKNIFLKGLPDPEGLQKATDEMKKLQQMNLPSVIYFKRIKELLEEIPIR